MPDAIITSTASTFGTISGTFAADQSMVTGTVTGIITGTLSGSVGVPGATGPAGPGVPAGGTAGQYLQKIDGTNYNTDWVTVNLGAYAVKANNLSDLTNFATARDNLGLGLLYTPTFAGVTVQGAGANVANLTPTSLTLNHTGYGYFTIQPSQGIRFPDASVQTTAFPAGSDVPTGGTTGQALVKVSNSNYDVDWATVASYITSVSSPLSVTTGNLTIDLSAYLTSATAASTYQTLAGMSSYLTTATAASTYAVIAAGQPTAGTTGQVLTKNSGTNYDSSWQTLIPGDRYLTSSTTSNTVSNGNKTFTIGTGLSYTPTQNITISYNAANHMHGEVLTYNSGTGVLTVDINHHTGSGTYTAWVVNVGGVTPATSVAWGAITGTISAQTDLQGQLDLKLAVTTAASTYQTLSGMSSYLTTSAATSTYYLQTNPAGYITSAALTGYATESWVTSGFVDIASTQTISGAKTFSSATLVLGNSTSNTTISIGNGVIPSGVTKTINIGAGGQASSTTNITIGSVAGTTTTTLRGTTNGVTAAADTNSVALATTAFVVGQAGSSTPLVDGTAAVGTSLRYAREDHVHGTDTTRAPLASPTFTGTPSLPTGTIATTQTAGNNTTAVATTAFVTAAVPAFATTAQVVTGTSTTTALNPGHAGFLKADPRLRQLGACNNTTVAGSGAITGGSGQIYAREMYLGSLAAGRAGYTYGYIGSEAGMLTSKANKNQINFSKKIWVSGSCSPGITSGGTSYIGDANTVARVSFGGYSTNATGDMTQKGIGWRKTGGAASFINLSVHNGATLTNVATTVAVAANEVIDWMIYSDGTGNVTLYINGTQAATTSAGPTGTTTAGHNAYYEQVEGTGTPTVRHAMHAHSGWIYLAD